MSPRVKNILKGIGSVLDIYPASSYDEFLQAGNRKTDAENLRGDWEKVGKALSSAMSTVAPHGQEHQK